MAEFAQRRIEEMTVEVEKMRKIGLFTTDESRALMKKRKRFEYKLQRRTKEKEVYFQYIQYEIAALKMIRLRREKRNIELGKEEIEKEIIMRIYQLFRIACFRFKSDAKIWLSHIDFAKQCGDRQRVSKIFTSLLQVHNLKPSLWIMAAKFEFEMNESIDSARNLFQRAIRFLPHSNKIWLEYFKMELLCVEVIMKRKELLGMKNEEEHQEHDGAKENDKIEDAILSCKIVEIVFRNAVKETKQNVPEIVSSLIQIASEFNFTQNLIESMYKFLSESDELSRNEHSWDILARRHLHQEAEILRQCEKNGQVADFTIAEFEEKTNETYLQAIHKLGTDYQPMHLVYIKFCLERLKLNSKFLNDERFERLDTACRNAQAHFDLPLDYLLEWIEFLINFNRRNEAASLIETSLVKNKSNKDLHKLNLKMCICKTNKKNEEELFKVFYKSLKCLKEKESFDLWKLIIDWSLLNESSQTENLLQEASQKVNNTQVSVYARLRYLTWSLQSDENIKKVRKIYENFRKIPPYSAEFHLKYIEMEKCATVTKLDQERIANAFEDAVGCFGAQDIDLWMSYINFAYSNENNKKGSSSSVSNIYWRALKTLGSELVETFTQRFCLFKNDVVGTEIEMD